MKRCCYCKQVKPLETFHRDRSQDDGRQRGCIDCNKARYVKPIRKKGEHLPKQGADLTNAHAQAVATSQRKHKERFNAYQREYRARPENAEKMALKRKRDAAWRKAKERDNRLTVDELRAKAKVDNYYRAKQWVADHPERAAELSRRGAMHHYALKRDAAGSATADQIAARWRYYGGRCWMCGEVATQTDHVIPLNRGGSDWPANQRPACARCNRAKSDKPLSVFLAAAL